MAPLKVDAEFTAQEWTTLSDKRVGTPGNLGANEKAP